MPPQSRMGDMHECPMETEAVVPIPHVGGVILSGYPKVLVGGLPAARMGDEALCVGAVDVIAEGYPKVLIGGMPAAYLGCLTEHLGTIIEGYPKVIVG